jgi:hypothetical protein
LLQLALRTPFIELKVGCVDDEPAQLRLKAEACRQLADTSEEAKRKALWIERAEHWEKLAKEAEKRAAKKTRPQ